MQFLLFVVIYRLKISTVFPKTSKYKLDIGQNKNMLGTNTTINQPPEHPSIMIGMIDAKVIFRILKWEHQWRKDLQLQIPPDTSNALFENEYTLVSALKTLGLFVSSLPSLFAHTFLAKKESHLLDRVADGIITGGCFQGLLITRAASEMLKYFCKYDPPNDPSVLFDVITTGAMILALALNDNKNGSNFYILSLEALCTVCGIDDRYGRASMYMVNTSHRDLTIQHFIFQIGYKALIEKSLPFDGIVKIDYFVHLAGIIPAGHFARYNLTTAVVDQSPTLYRENHGARALIITHADYNLMPEATYDLELLKKLALCEYTEDYVFNETISRQNQSVLPHTDVSVAAALADNDVAEQLILRPH